MKFFYQKFINQLKSTTSERNLFQIQKEQINAELEALTKTSADNNSIWATQKLFRKQL